MNKTYTCYNCSQTIENHAGYANVLKCLACNISHYINYNTNEIASIVFFMNNKTIRVEFWLSNNELYYDIFTVNQKGIKQYIKTHCIKITNRPTISELKEKINTYLLLS